MKRFHLYIAAAAIALSPLLTSTALAQVNVNIVLGEAPPPPRVESVPAPRRGYLWVPGYWRWDGRHHSWANGHWERARSGQHYEAPTWQHDGDKWRFKQGGWKQVKHDKKHREHDERDDDERHDRGYHCPPGQAKKGNC